MPVESRVRANLVAENSEPLLRTELFTIDEHWPGVAISVQTSFRSGVIRNVLTGGQGCFRERMEAGAAKFCLPRGVTLPTGLSRARRRIRGFPLERLDLR